MDRSKFRKLAGIGCAAAVIGAAFALAGPSIGSTPPDQTAPGTCVDLARDVDPQAVPVDSGYDPEKNVVYAHYAGRTYVLQPDDPTCRALAASRSVIEDAVRTDRENEAMSCREMGDAVAQGRTEVRGRAFDRAAAQRYLAERCANAG
ncbi:MAG: hypothetical protein ACRDKS_07885 [Actinomycetota bacterium]